MKASTQLSIVVGILTVVVPMTTAVAAQEVVAGVDAVRSRVPAGGRHHVGDLDGAAVRDQRAWHAEVTVTVEDVRHVPVYGALVMGVWNNIGGDTECVTDIAGRCTLRSRRMWYRGQSSFALSYVAYVGSVYDEAANHDRDGDSTAFSIQIERNDPHPEPVQTVHVASWYLDSGPFASRRRVWEAVARVVVADQWNRPISGVTVHGRWRVGNRGRQLECMTGPDGECVLARRVGSRRSEATFEFDGLERWDAVYDAAADELPAGMHSTETMSVFRP